MKRVKAVLGHMLVVGVMALFAFPFLPPIFAADSGNTGQTRENIPGTDLYIHTIVMQAAADNSKSDVTIRDVEGYVTRVEFVYPDAFSVPTTAFDVTLLNGNGYDIMGGALANIDTSEGLSFHPKSDKTAGLYGPIAVNGNLTLTVANNSQADAQVTAIIHIDKD